MREFSKQFTVRAMVLGVLGSAIITASSIYVALKLGALPWPIFFVTLFAYFALKLLRHTNLNEVNVAATAMSAGAMVAGGIAYVVPGIYLNDPGADVSLWTIFACVLSGVLLGLVFVSLIRAHFIDDSELAYPIGQGAASMLLAGDQGGGKAKVLFASMGIAGVFAVIRDWFGAIPQLLFSKVGQYLPGVTFGVYASPMALAIGFMLEPAQVLVWFVGALIADFGIVVGGTSLGLWDTAAGQGIKTSLGIGLMIGLGVGIIVKIGGKKILELVRSRRGQAAAGSTAAAAGGSGAADGTSAAGGDAVVAASGGTSAAGGTAAADGAAATMGSRSIIPVKWMPFILAAVVLVLVLGGGVELVPALLLVAFTWVVVFIAAQCVGQAGLDPLEVFGLLVLLVIAFVWNVGGVEAFLICTVAAVACGLCGDVMNDFKAGHILKSSPKAQWYAELIGGVTGAVVGTLVIGVLISAYGADCFGLGHEFTAAQATAIASMVGGIANMPAFIIGLLLGCALFVVGAPVITLGLGVYLPFYLSLTVSLGMLVRLVCQKAAPTWTARNGNIMAAGLLGGESVVGVIIALISVVSGLALL